MGFHKPNLDPAYGSIRQSLSEISSPFNDGFTSSCCKQELYQLKCWLDREYAKLPIFDNEDDWEKEYMWETLKK